MAETFTPDRPKSRVGIPLGPLGIDGSPPIPSTGRPGKCPRCFVPGNGYRRAPARLAPRRAETAGSTGGVAQVALFPLDGIIRRDDQLRNAVAFLDGVLGPPQ